MVPGTCCESASLQDEDVSAPEYQAFERQLYRRALERMGFRDVLTPEQEQVSPKVKNHQQNRGNEVR